MDIYDELKSTEEVHYVRKHIERKKIYPKDVGCTKCYLEKVDEAIPEEFLKFWEILQKLVPEAEGFNWNTIQGFRQLLEYESDEEREEVKNMKAIDLMIRSIRYRNIPTKVYSRIKTDVETIMEKCVSILDESVLVEDYEKLQEEILNDKMVRNYGHKLGEVEIRRRWKRFLDWYQGIVAVKVKENNVMKYFKELLHLEQEIADEENFGKIRRFQKEMSYKNIKGMTRFHRPWENKELTKLIRDKFIEERGFAIIVKLKENEFEIVSSDESDLGDPHEKRLGVRDIQKIVGEWGIAVTEDDIERILRLGMEELVPKIDFWEEYQKWQEESDEILMGKIAELSKRLIEQDEKRIRIIDQVARKHKIYITNEEANILTEYNLNEDEITYRVITKFLKRIRIVTVDCGIKTRRLIEEEIVQYAKIGENEEMEALTYDMKMKGTYKDDKEVSRLWNLGFERQMLNKEFMVKYREIEDELDTEVARLLNDWIEEKRKKKEVDLEIDEKELEQIYIAYKEFYDDFEISDIRRLLILGFDQYEFGNPALIEEYKKNKHLKDRLLAKKLAKYLSEDHEETQDEDHFRKSETSSEEEERSSDESEKLINTPGKSPSEHSDSET